MTVTSENKPSVLPPILDAIPVELKDRAQWVAWRLELREDEWAKVPHNPHTGRPAKANDPSTWGAFDAAVSLSERDGYSGVGFEFSADDPYVGIDLDDCRDPEAGIIEPWARKIVEQVNSYTEVSPSGTGVKIFVRGKKPGPKCRKLYAGGEVEIYDQKRYFAVTGHHVPGTPMTIEDRQAELEAVYNEVFGQPEKASPPPHVSGNGKVDLGDEELLGRVRRAKHGDKFSLLFDCGDTDDYATPSEADLGLCRRLAFWTGGDAVRIDRLFRQSALYRKKWDRQDYRERTIAKALERQTEYYNPNKNGQPVATGEDALTVSDPDGIATAMISQCFTVNNQHSLARHCEQWQVWNGKSYRPVPEEDFRARLRAFLADQTLFKVVGDKVRTVKPSAHTTNEVLDSLKGLANIEQGVTQPAWLAPKNSDPHPADIIAFQNGLLDIKTNRIISHTPRWFSQNALPFSYDPAATCGEWLAFLADVSCGDDEWVRALQLWFGYCLTSDTRQQKMMVLVGPPRAGKGIICRVLQNIIGEENYCNPTLGSLEAPFGLMPLRGKTAAILPDAHVSGRGDAQAIVERLKSIIGEDDQQVNVKFASPFNTKLKVRFTMSVNQLVNLPDAADALTPRCILLPFEKSYVGREDLELGDRLAAESPGILNWALAGLRDLRQAGRPIQPVRGREILADLARLVSPVKAFVEELCIVGDPGQETPCQELYGLWQRWCNENGHKPGGEALFGEKLRAASPKVTRHRPRDEKGRYYAYRCIAIDYQAVHEAYPDWCIAFAAAGRSGPSGPRT